MWGSADLPNCAYTGFHGVRRYRLAEPTSVADGCGSYQTSPNLEIPLEHCEALMLPRDFDHTVAKVGWTVDFNYGVRR